MNNLSIEHVSFDLNNDVEALTQHINRRLSYGKIVIISDNPEDMLMRLQKYIHSSLLSTSYSPDEIPADITIATKGQLLAWPPECRALYVCSEVELKDLYAITGCMERGVVVRQGVIRSTAINS